MQHLPKHLRPRWRYLAVGIESRPGASIDRGQFQRHLWYGAQNLIGDAGSARIDLTVLSFSFREEQGAGGAVLRVRRDQVEQARAVLAALAEVDGVPVGVRVRGVSGTVRACEEKYMGRRPEDSEQRHVVFQDSERPAVLVGDRVAVRTDGAYVGATTLDLQ